MNFKKLNEELQKFIEGNINELSYETKKSYLAKRKAQFDKAKAQFDKANRLVRNTEKTKEGKRKLNDDQLSQILDNIKKEFPKWGDRYFYKDMRKEWGWLEAGDTDEASNACYISLTYDDKYLQVRIRYTGAKAGKIKNEIIEKFSLDDFNFFRLNNKVISYMKNFMKTYAKEEAKDNKYHTKIVKTLDQIRKLMSRLKGDMLDPNNKRDKRIAYEYSYSNIRPLYKAVVSIPSVFVSNKAGHEKDYEILAVTIDNATKIGLCYISSNNITRGKLSDLNATEQEKEKALNKILDILKGKIQGGRSTLKADQKKFEQRKQLAKEAADEFRSLIKSTNSGRVDSPKENGHSYEIFTDEWGEWGTSDDWEEDNDFMKPTEETYQDASNICKAMQKKYPDLKFTYSVSEKRMLSFYVEY